MNISVRTEKLMWTVALVSVGCSLFFVIQASVYRALSARLSTKAQSTAHSRLIHSPHQSDSAQVSIQMQPEFTSGRNILGRLEIPALHLSVAILSNYDPSSLLRGIGHIRETAMPGGLGTVGIAGHRDTFFRPLRKISPKMDIRLIDKTGAYHYIVDSTEIVTPDNVEVLNITSRPELILITCFPFEYIGPAPKRFVVHAHLSSVLPEPLLSSTQ
ncbi:MAG TPA: class D sortase [Edaphobacter sp.]|nr:class D sortase [Edaphobacter sp.]